MIPRLTGRAAALVSLVLLAGCASGPEATVKGFYKALDAGDVQKATGYLSSQLVQTFGQDKLGTMLEQFAGRMADCGGLDSVEVSLSPEGDTRHGNSTVTFAGECPAADNSVVVVKEEDGWKLGLSK